MPRERWRREGVMHSGHPDKASIAGCSLLLDDVPLADPLRQEGDTEICWVSRERSVCVK